MSCEEIRGLFSGHLDGDLSLEAEDRLGGHVGACRACREELARYEAGVGALAGLHPEPPRELPGRVARRLRSAGLLTRSSDTGWWRLLAAGLAVLALGLTVGRLTAPRDDDGARSESRVSPRAWMDSCAGASVPGPSLDPRAWRAATGSAEPALALTTGARVLHLPRRLTSHGPYDTDAFAAVEHEESTCVPLRAPFGSGLALSLRPTTNGDASETEAFVVEADPRRVLYGRVFWHQHGLTWSLEGRADGAELLTVAREIAARARVEGDGDRM